MDCARIFMLKDRFFYPLAILVAMAMIGLALSFAQQVDLSDTTIWEEGYVMEGTDLSRLTAQPGTQANFHASMGGQPAFARLTTTTARENLPPGPGIFAPLGPDYERAFSGRLLRLTITARPSTINPLPAFDMGYFSAGAGDSGWKRRDLKQGWSDYEMEFRPGLRTAAPDLDYFAIWPGETAEALSMDVKRMRVEVLDRPR